MDWIRRKSQPPVILSIDPLPATTLTRAEKPIAVSIWWLFPMSPLLVKISRHKYFFQSGGKISRHVFNYWHSYRHRRDHGWVPHGARQCASVDPTSRTPDHRRSGDWHCLNRKSPAHSQENRQWHCRSFWGL